jgi:transcription termination factor Rho
MAAQAAYQTSMALIRERFISLDGVIDEARLLRAERVAFQARKIIEGVAYAALSAVEHINSQTLAAQRTKDADKLLTWLNSKGMLRLPNAQRMEPSPSPDYAVTLSGAASDDMTLEHSRVGWNR